MITPESTYQKLGHGLLAKGFICTTNPTREANAIRCAKAVLSYFNIDAAYDKIASIDFIKNDNDFIFTNVKLFLEIYGITFTTCDKIPNPSKIYSIANPQKMN